ncbi:MULTISPECIES: ferredoxin [unclassified Mycobacterium]|uniref:ferredoxin n=1 Tax=unclassified Mycobacterium TaxID=2642494 RepID=UPI0029C746BB|nr:MULTISPECIES: ferredoxin [unclassified Mycobacterium]
MPLYVKVDEYKCCGYTACADVCPEVYKLDDSGFAFVDESPVRPDLEEKAIEGAQACPEGAITTSEEPLD